jgi:chaperonin GroEL
MPKTITTGTDARKRLLNGALQLSRAVTVTYGPAGRTCILDRMAGLLATKDGVTVAREVDLADPVANQGAKVLREACITVNNEVGDGTTTAAILAGEMLREGHKYIAVGADPNQMVRGMYAARDAISEELQGLAEPIRTQADLERVAMIASNGDAEVARNLAEACMAVGQDGTITIEDGQGLDVVLEFREGLELDRGAASSEFLGTDIERVMEGPLVAVLNVSLHTLDDVKELMEVASQWPKNELLVFCKSISGEALATMTLNNKEQVVRCCAIQAPGMSYLQGAYLEDIAALAGATFVDPEAGYPWQFWDAEWFGSLRKATVKAKSTVLLSYDEASEVLEEHLEKLRAQERHCVSDYDRDRLKERLAKLSGGLAILKIGGHTEAALKERRARVEDALGSVRSALRDGVVPGGGSAYYHAAERTPYFGDAGLDSYRMGWNLVLQALKSPVRKLMENAGYTGDVGLLSGRDPWEGWDVMQCVIRDLKAEPHIIDPTGVTLAALRAAVSVSATLLTVEVAITGSGKRA